MIARLPARKFIFQIKSAVAMPCRQYYEVAVFHISKRNLDLKDINILVKKKKANSPVMDTSL